MTEEKKWLGTWPADCNLCNTDLSKTGTFFDAKVKGRGWALLCPICFAIYGVGIGTGRGQEYDSETLKKLHG